MALSKKPVNGMKDILPAEMEIPFHAVLPGWKFVHIGHNPVLLFLPEYL